MNIIVLIKQVPDTVTRIQDRVKNGTVDLEGVTMVVNPYDVEQTSEVWTEMTVRIANQTVAEEHRLKLPVAEIAEVWRRGSVLSSWLIDLTAKALVEDPELGKFTGSVQDSGEGRWTVNAAIEESVPANVITASLFTRFRSRQDHSFAEKVLSAMRFQFGGHEEKH